MESRAFGETRGPFFVWLFSTLYFALLKIIMPPSTGALPSNLTIPILLSLLVDMASGYGVVFVMLLAFLVVYEKRKSVREILSGLGLRAEGCGRSVLWSLALLPLFVVVGLVTMNMGILPIAAVDSASGSGNVPFWYLWYLVIQAFFPVAVVEEAFARGYVLDRLMPEHPLGLLKALPAVILSSVMFTLWHIPSYIGIGPSQMTKVFVILAFNVLPISLILSVAYVKAGTRNIIGPILVHFLLDALPLILLLTQLS